jgi:hypothetical protein
MGIEILDKALILRLGQLVTLFGKGSLSILFLLCVRATLPEPLGPDSNVLFVDGGNLFDPYSISRYSVEHELNPENVIERILISRAFTHHQLSTLITEKLPTTMEETKAKIAVVSDISSLFCDPDIRGREKRDSVHIFLKAVRFLAALAEQRHALILITDLLERNLQLRNILKENSHVCAELEEKNSVTQLTLFKHPWNPSLRMMVSAEGNPTLDRYA